MSIVKISSEIVGWRMAFSCYGIKDPWSDLIGIAHQEYVAKKYNAPKAAPVVYILEKNHLEIEGQFDAFFESLWAAEKLIDWPPSSPEEAS